MLSLKITPESYLFRKFLEKKGWNIKDTYEDSVAALKKYVYLLNTWDIDLRWKSQRSPFLSAGSLILPYTFKMRPFDNAPIENCKCINKHQLNKQKPNFRDLFFISFSFIIFKLKFNNGLFKVNKLVKYKVKYNILKILKKVACLLPYFIVCNLIKKIDEKVKKAKIKCKQMKTVIQ